MVQLGDFTIQLVDPQSKHPFPEHYHDGKTFVEINRGAEFLIAVSKPRAKLFSGTVVLRFYVDGNYLGFNLTYTASGKSLNPKYKGNWKREGGISTDTAIPFIPPTCSDADNKSNSKSKKVSMFGKVKVKVYPTFVQVADATKQNGGKLGYDKDCLLSTLTLYCGTPQNLMQAGVIPQAMFAQTQNTTSYPNSSEHNNDPSRKPPPNQSDGIKRSTAKEGASDFTEEDDSDSDSPIHMYHNAKTHAEEDFESESVVFVDPDMDVIAIDDLSSGDEDFHDAIRLD